MEPDENARLDHTTCPHSYPLFYEPLGLDEGHRFLEVGMGSGYGTAVARQVVGSGGVVVSVLVQFKGAPTNVIRRGHTRTSKQVRTVVQEAAQQESLIVHMAEAKSREIEAVEEVAREIIVLLSTQEQARGPAW